LTDTKKERKALHRSMKKKEKKRITIKKENVEQTYKKNR